MRPTASSSTSCVDEVLAQAEPRLPGIGERAAFVFISSPSAVTPYHIDPEHNFLLQIRGWKTMSVFPEADRSLISEQELESFYSGAHRNLVFRERYQDKAEVFRLDAGVGLHVPVDRAALGAERRSGLGVFEHHVPLRSLGAPRDGVQGQPSAAGAAPLARAARRPSGDRRREALRLPHCAPAQAHDRRAWRDEVVSAALYHRSAVSRVRLFLVRHGQVSSNRDLRYIGSRDEPLTELGRKQAAALAELMAPLPIAEVRSSPLSRAYDTASAIAARDRPHRRRRATAARAVVRVVGRTLARRGARAIHRRLGPPQGVGARRCRSRRPAASRSSRCERRALDLVADLRAAATDDAMPWIVLVSHVGPIKALLAASLDLPLDRGGRRIFLDPGTVSVVDWGDPPILRLCNSHAHAGWTSARWMRDARGQSQSSVVVLAC